MEKYVNKVAVVTGSSSGIGAAISRELVKCKVIVVGVGRRTENLQKLADELNEPGKPIRFYPLKCDVTVEIEIENSFKWITTNLGPIAILVNNAGIIRPSLLCNVTGESISKIFDTNVKASVLWSKLAVQSMTSNSISGHIININSIAGHTILNIRLTMNQIYTASKHALKVFSESLRRELVSKNLDIKVTNLSPGAVVSEMTKMSLPDIETLPEKKIMQPKDIAEACLYVLSTPPNILISELTIMPIHQNV